MLFGLAAYENQVRFDAPIRRQDDGAIPHAALGLDAFGEVDFFGLEIWQLATPPMNSESVEVSPYYN